AASLLRCFACLLAGLVVLGAVRLTGLEDVADLHLAVLGTLGQCRSRCQARSEYQHRESRDPCGELSHDVSPLARVSRDGRRASMPMRPDARPWRSGARVVPRAEGTVVNGFPRSRWGILPHPSDACGKSL